MLWMRYGFSTPVKAKFALHLDTRETRNYAGRLGRMEFRKRLSTSLYVLSVYAWLGAV